MQSTASTIDPEEIERFTRMADEWWDPRGKFKPLHDLNPTRVGWILQQIKAAGISIQGAKLLDIGCGGGLVSEAMAKAGAQVTGIDAGEKNIAVASLHAEKSALTIDYRCTSAEALAADGVQYDVVLALEIIEHVAYIPAFVEATCKLVKPGGLIVYSTLNRTPKSFALAIVGAEYVLRWLPRGTHDWNKFVKPSELHAHLRANDINVVEMTGLTMNPLSFEWSTNPRDVSVNYLVAGTKSRS